MSTKLINYFNFRQFGVKLFGNLALIHSAVWRYKVSLIVLFSFFHPFFRGLDSERRAFLSNEMVPSIVDEDGIALRVYCWIAGASANSLWQG